MYCHGMALNDTGVPPMNKTKSLCCSIFLLPWLPVSGADVVVPNDTASRETLRLSSEESTLRLAGMDIFPHASGTVLYDDNVTIGHTNQIDDVIWKVAPGITITGGDVGAYLPGAVTLEQLRSFLYYSLVDDVSKPGRFFGFDYTPSLNFYTDHSQFNDVGHSVKFTGGYALTRLALGLDFDMNREQLKNNSVGTLTKVANYDTRLRALYDFNDRTSAEVGARYRRTDYEVEGYQGYQEVSNENWLNRKFADRLSLGLGMGVGRVIPQNSESQTFEQGLVRAVYRLSGKLFLSSAVGMEFRQYDSGESGTVNPVVAVSGTYQLREGTTLNLEGHRREQPTVTGGYNSTQMGAILGVRQLLFSRLYAGASAGYDNVKYNGTERNLSSARSDDYLFGRLTFDYEFNRHFTGTIYYNYFRDNSSEDQFSYDNNLLGLQLRWHL